MSLKELTLKEHRFAEEQDFANLMMSGNIENYVYFHYLINQHSIYNALENTYYNLPDNRLARAKAIDTDIEELKLMGPMPVLCYDLEPSTKEYVQYVKEHIHTDTQYLAHIYVRYLGDLRGGQMIARKIPGSGKYYEFGEPKVLAESIYSRLDDSMADEAKVVFDFATRLFQELYARHFQNPKKVRTEPT
jgi:heme oxygenase